MTDAVGSTTNTAAQTNLAAGQASLNESYTTFLTLLTTQLKNQDPTSPMDTTAFTQQLVAMTGVQQQLLTNQLLQTISNNSSSTGVAGAVDLIGKTATATSSTATLSSGAANWSYNLPSNAAGATITVSDSTGKTVYSTSAAAAGLTAGDHAFSWNGKDFSGTQLADGGTYTLSINATDSAGAAITPTLSVSGQVSSVTQSNGVTLVKIGPTAVPLTSITSVTSQ